eukprot:6213255-Pleurochrysis_carterae.AAC.4
MTSALQCKLAIGEIPIRSRVCCRAEVARNRIARFPHGLIQLPGRGLGGEGSWTFEVQHQLRVEAVPCMFEFASKAAH